MQCKVLGCAITQTQTKMDIKATPGESIKMLSEYHSNVLQLTYIVGMVLENNLISDDRILESLKSAQSNVRKFYGERNGR